MDYINRSLEETFLRLNSTHAIVALVGARQAGKTTFVRKQAKNLDSSYVLFDDPDQRKLFEQDIKKFDMQYVEPYEIAVLDEVQYCDRAGEKLKYLADVGRNLWITSSSEVILKEDILSYLVGRVAICNLYPFHFQEFLRARDQTIGTENMFQRMIWEHTVYGGYPRVVMTEGVKLKKDILRNLYETMILKDVAYSFSIENVERLKRLTKHLSHHIGTNVQYQTLSDDLDLSFKTVKKYLDALERSYILKRVRPFCTNKRKELKKRPKYFFIDTGLRNQIASKFPDQLTGPLFENYVFCELLKMGKDVKYWRTKSGSEVDFIVDSTPVEVKRNAGKVPSGLRSFIQRYEPDQALIVTLQQHHREETCQGCSVHFVNPQSINSLLENGHPV